MVQTQPIVLAGDYTFAGLPLASSYKQYFAWVTDQVPTPKLYWSDGVTWRPSIRRIERYAGVSDGSGNYTIVYPNSFPMVPDIQPVLDNPNTQTNFRVTARTMTGFTVNVFERTGLTVLGITLLSFATTPVVGQAIYVDVFEIS